jgi:SanA protein
MDPPVIASMAYLPFLIIFLTLLMSLVCVRWHLVRQTKACIFKQKDPATYRTAIVFGAGVNRELFPTKALSDRLDKTIQLVKEGQFDRILLSGGRTKTSSECAIMQAYLVNHTISPQLLLLDEEGFSTFDTLLRAKNVFHIQQAALITQRFHLPRAIGIAKMLKMDVVGISADLQRYKLSSRIWWSVREALAWIWSVIKVKTRSGI